MRSRLTAHPAATFLALVLCAPILAWGREPHPAPIVENGTLVYNFAQKPLVNVATGEIEVTTENSTPMPSSGYGPLRVFVRNLGRQPHEVELRFVHRGGSGAEVQKEITVAPGTRQVVTLPVPAGVTYGQLLARSRGIEEGGVTSLYFQTANQTILAIGDDQQFQDFAGRAPDHNTYTTLVRTLPSDEAPVELAAYVGFDEVVLLAPLESLAEGIRAALEAYAATGGTLIVARAVRTPEAYLPLLPSAEAGNHRYGFGRVWLCQDHRDLCASGMSAELAANGPRVRPVAPTRYGQRYVYDAVGNAVSDDERFMLPQATAPIGRFLLIILAFTLAIGPGSVWVARRRGPPMLLLTIPATAAITCLLIVGYSLVVDGFTVHGAARSYTLLDAKNDRAITLGVQAFYANVSPGRATFDLATAIVGPPQAAPSNQVASIDWTNGARFDSDFVPSRTYREWGVMSVTPTRARLVAKPSADGNALEVQNALGARIDAALIRSGGVLWLVRDLDDGRSRQAERMADENAAQNALWHALHGAGSLGVVSYATRFDARVIQRAEDADEDGTFVAYLEGGGMLPLGGLRVNDHGSRHVVRGEVTR